MTQKLRKENQCSEAKLR